MNWAVDRGGSNYDAVKTVVHGQVRKDDNYVANVNSVHEQMLTVDGDNGTVDSTPSNAPNLSPPPRLSRSGVLAKFLAELISLIGDSNVKDLESKLEIYKAQMKSAQESGKKLSDEFETAVNNSETATSDYKSSKSEYETARSVYDNAVSDEGGAKSKLDDLDKKGVDKESDEYKTAKNAVESATAKVTSAEKTVNGLKTALDAAEKKATAAANKADACLTECNKAGVDNDAVVANGKRHLGNLAEMTLLLADASKTMGEDSEKSLNNDLAIFKAMQDARIKEMDKKAEDIDKQEKKSEALGCIGKILGFLVTLVSVVGAIFTGGATLALAVVGLALMAADEVCKAVTGKSFIEAALKPLMDNIIKPLMEKLGKMLSGILMAFGVDKETADIVGNALASVVVALVMVAAVSMVGRGAVNNMASKMTDLIADKLGKFMPQILKDLGTGVSQGMGKTTQRLQNFMSGGDKETQNLIERGANYAQTGGVVLKGGTDIEKGFAEKHKADATADFMVAKASMDQIKEWIQQSIDTFNKAFQGTQDMVVTISGYIAKNEEAGKFVLRETKA